MNIDGTLIITIVLLALAIAWMVFLFLIPIAALRRNKYRRAVQAGKFLNLYREQTEINRNLSDQEIAQANKGLLDMANELLGLWFSIFTLSRTWALALVKEYDLHLPTDLRDWIYELPELQNEDGSKIHPWLQDAVAQSRKGSVFHFLVYATTKNWDPVKFGLTVYYKTGKVYKCSGDASVIAELDKDPEVVKIE